MMGCSLDDDPLIHDGMFPDDDPSIHDGLSSDDDPGSVVPCLVVLVSWPWCGSRSSAEYMLAPCWDGGLLVRWICVGPPE